MDHKNLFYEHNKMRYILKQHQSTILANEIEQELQIRLCIVVRQMAM